MKVVSYLSTVPANNNNKQKTDLLKYYIEGVKSVGDTGIVTIGNSLVDCDVGMIQGWVYEKKTTPHLKLRNNIILSQTQNNKYVCTGDANLFLYANGKNPHGYLRYSFNGIFPNTGIYCDSNINSNRWESISKDYNIQLEPMKNKGRHILVMLQRQGGWSMKGNDVIIWAQKTIKRIQKYSQRPIVIRPHPGDKKAVDYLYHRLNPLKNISNVKISPQGRPLEEDLRKAWAVVNYNSSSVVGPIIQGYHSFITDPETSQCAEVSNTNFQNIENPDEFDRLQWVRRISMFHWKFEELRDGSCWRHMRTYCQ
jgi:hypothetical protein